MESNTDVFSILIKVKALLNNSNTFFLEVLRRFVEELNEVKQRSEKILIQADKNDLKLLESNLLLTVIFCYLSNSNTFF